jgi:hypothetical protein
MSADKDKIIARLGNRLRNPEDSALVSAMLTRLDQRYDLTRKIIKEPGVEDIISQLVGRIETAFGSLAAVRGRRILDIACGSSTSKEPSLLSFTIPFSRRKIWFSKARGFTAKFEPWCCRILLASDAQPVGVDIGNLEGEAFEYYEVDLGLKGALDILPSHSFDGIQDSRLFGSPEFTAQFPDRTARLRVAREIREQEQRLLKKEGIIIHSDAAYLLRDT